MTEAQRTMLGRLDAALLAGGGTHRFQEDVMPMLLDGRAQFWQHDSGCAVTEINDHPRLREVNVWLTAGNLDDCLALQPAIQNWARAQGAQRIVGAGRMGWARVCVARMGARLSGVTVEWRL